MVKVYGLGFLYLFVIELSILLSLLMGYAFLWFLPLIVVIETCLYRTMRRSYAAYVRRQKKKGHRPEPDGLSIKETSAVSIVTQGRRKVKVLCYE